MIVLVDPRATRPQNRRFPPSPMAPGAALPGGVSWEIVGGNRPGLDPFREVSARVDPLSGTPANLEDGTRPEWVGWMTHEDPRVPWMTAGLKAKALDFETVLKSRLPSVHDTRTRSWGKTLARLLAAPRWTSGRYQDPRLLRLVRKRARVPDEDRQAYGRLRTA